MNKQNLKPDLKSVVIELCYQLAELPSCQHRAGLAGLVLMVQELFKQPGFEDRGNLILELSDLDQHGVKLTINWEGIKSLFDFTYQSFKEERSTSTKIKDYERIEEVTIEKQGKTALQKMYYYSVTTPQGAFLSYWDNSDSEGNQGLWIKLWRDMLWNVVRGIPTTRNPFEDRCDGKSSTKDSEEIWKDLNQPNKIAQQKGNYHLAAASKTADNIPTQDLARYQFLLHFAPFIFQIYRPSTINKDGNREFSSYAIVVPDIANLERFTEEFPQLLKQRDNAKSGYLPREAVIDLVKEGALDVFILQDRLARATGEKNMRKSILGAEVFHAEKAGNSIKFQLIGYVEPVLKMTDRYAQIKDNYWCPWFRKQRLLNLFNSYLDLNYSEGELKEIPPWNGFDSVLSRIPRKWLENTYFSHDAHQLFRQEILLISGENSMITQSSTTREYARIVYDVCQTYILRKLESKYSLKWSECKDDKNKIKEYNEKKTKVANEAFLAVRSRSESQSFIDYFVSTLYPFIRRDEFIQFADSLFNKTDEIRSLTLLALSSQFGTNKGESGE